MANRTIEMYEYRNIIYRLSRGQSVRSIADDGLAGRHKINEIQRLAKQQGWLDPEVSLPNDAQLSNFFQSREGMPRQRSKAEPYFDEIKSWVESGIQASTIHQYLVAIYGFNASYNSVQRLVKRIKASAAPDLTVPLHFKPGEAAQIDFGKGPRIYDARVGKEVDSWFFVMTLCWSRHQYAEFVTHQDIETWLLCHQRAFNWFDGVVNKVIIDNPKCAITKACYHDPDVQRSYEELAQSYGFIISACPPRDPQKKGRVESGVKYIKKNFLPLRHFSDLADANQQLKAWVLSAAGQRRHGSTFKQPLTQFADIEQHQLKALPEQPSECAVWKKVSLYRHCHVRFDYCYYSAPHRLYKQELWIKVNASSVFIYHQHEMVAMHPRLFIPGEYSTKHEHLPDKARAYFERDATWCIEKSQQVGESCHHVIDTLLSDPVRDLLRQSQLILRLHESYGCARLEQACKRAINFNAINYTTIKRILKEGLDYEPLTSDDTFDQLGAAYQGHALYQRQLSDEIH